MSNKVILCRCEDVTLSDVKRSVDLGYADIEEVKRYTGFGTGPCQGKECLATIALKLCELTGSAPTKARPFTSRPPIASIPMALLAAEDENEDSGS